MASFQEQIDAALKPVAHEGKTMRAAVHFVPIAEQEHRAAVIAHLPHRAIPQGKRLHAGVAGVFNLHVAAETRPDYLLLLDINTQQPKFWKEVIALLKKHPTQEGFWKDMQAHIHLDSFVTDSGKAYEVRGSFYLRDHRLSDMGMSEEGYAHLHRLACEDKIATAVIDLFNDRKRCEALGNYLRDQEIHGDTFYWSNVASGAMPYEMHEGWTKNPVFKRDGEALEYNDMPYSGRQRGKLKWDGEEYSNGKKLTFKELPAMERMLRNVAALGGDTGMHCFLDMGQYRPRIITDGPPRNLARLAQRRGETPDTGLSI